MPPPSEPAEEATWTPNEPVHWASVDAASDRTKAHPVVTACTRVTQQRPTALKRARKPVNTAAADRAVRPCTVCGRSTAVFGTGTVLGRHPATFRRCDSCGTVFAEDPYWLAEAYERAIAAQDLGLVGRNVAMSDSTVLLSRLVFRRAEHFVDFGAGNGMFVRLMRDAGFDFRYVDAHGPNLFANGHEVELDGSVHFDLATGFEVLEHLHCPVADLKDLAAVSDALFLTTICLPEPAPPLNAWWYYALETGQHITFYTPRALDALAEQLGFYRQSHGNRHLFTRRRVPRSLLRIALSGKLSHHLSRVARRSTLLAEDYEQLTGRPLS